MTSSSTSRLGCGSRVGSHAGHGHGSHGCQGSGRVHDVQLGHMQLEGRHNPLAALIADACSLPKYHHDTWVPMKLAASSLLLISCLNLHSLLRSSAKALSHFKWPEPAGCLMRAKG
eukprot:1159871-Pelagomonas_calceolata.AAC.12